MGLDVYRTEPHIDQSHEHNGACIQLEGHVKTKCEHIMALWIPF